jgi:hypothetical protein
MSSNTVRISPPAPKFGGVDFRKSPRIGEARVRNLRPHIECRGFRGQTQELERLTEQYCYEFD